MRTSLVAVCLCLGYLEAATSLKLPSYIKACSRRDPKLNECALKNGREAIPKLINGDEKYRIPKLDPLTIDKIVVGDKPGSKIGLTFTCEKCKFYGLREAQLTAIRLDLKTRHIEVEGKVAKLTILGKYTASGKVLVLNINGSGDANVILNDGSIVFKANFDLYKQKDNKEYLKLKDPSLDFKINGLKINLSNLVKGDKALSDNMNVFLNENWQEVTEIFGPAVGEVLAETAVQIINNIAEKVPYDEIILK